MMRRKEYRKGSSSSTNQMSGETKHTLKEGDYLSISMYSRRKWLSWEEWKDASARTPIDLSLKRIRSENMDTNNSLTGLSGLF